MRKMPDSVSSEKLTRNTNIRTAALLVAVSCFWITQRNAFMPLIMKLSTLNDLNSIYNISGKSVSEYEIKTNYHVFKPGDSKNNDNNNFNNPCKLAGPDAVLQLPPPRVGLHRPDQDAIFSFALGYSVQSYARFVGSLLDAGYTGDIVLGVLPWNHSEMSQDTRDFLSYYAADNQVEEHSEPRARVVVHEIDLQCQTFVRRTRCQVPNFFMNTTTGEYIPDPRIHREIAQLRFEYYWAWSLQYLAETQTSSRIFLSDGRDVYFQRNPFAILPAASEMDKELYVFEEHPDPPVRHQNSNRLWVRSSRGMGVLNEIGMKTVLCSGTTVGGQTAMESYLRAMILSYDETECNIYGCDQGHHNYLVHTGRLLVNSTRIESISYGKQGASLVNTLGLYADHHRPFRAHGILDNTTNEVLNFDGSVSAVVHQFDRDEELKSIFEKRADEFFRHWNDTFHSS